MFRREQNPEGLPWFARQAEAAGFDELWVVEDCFYASGIAAAATALACTEKITVGLGIMPAVVRNPAFTAMEIATLCRLHPGRFLPGIGHGVAGWMRQVGAFPDSQLAALEEVTLAVRSLLAGETVTTHGRHVHLEKARLHYPPSPPPPPVSLGVVGPKSLRLSGRAADGTILSEYTNPAYMTWAKKQIKTGRAEARRTSPHRLTVFAFTAAERDALRPLAAGAIASGKIDPKLAPMGILAEAQKIREAGGQAALQAEMPDAWIDQLTITGSPDEWRAAINRFSDLGAASVVLVPRPDAGLDEVKAFAHHLSEG
jgi:alkanesulfonate monooxygenase SsuD/methylene tetrahydromethanopterin reductase-like flavin-dependent oxidoreductase (luciferase family)